MSLEVLKKKVIESLEITPDKRHLKFNILGENPKVFFAYGGCCSNSWFESLNGFENLIGFKVLEIIEKPETSNREEDEDLDKLIRYYGFSFKTERGFCDLEMRNSSNGYYGGSILSAENYSNTKYFNPDYEAPKEPFQKVEKDFN